MRRLLIMRHGKSDWSTGVPDEQRPLTDRGRRSARAMGELLARLGELPDHVLTSSATRALATAEAAAAAGAWEAEVEVVGDLYRTDPPGTLAVVARAPDVPRLMVVGHQPTWGGLVAHLTGGNVAVKTATVVAVDLYVGAWPDVGDAHGEIVFVLQPRHWLDAECGQQVVSR